MKTRQYSFVMNERQTVPHRKQFQVYICISIQMIQYAYTFVTGEHFTQHNIFGHTDCWKSDGTLLTSLLPITNLEFTPDEYYHEMCSES